MCIEKLFVYGYHGAHAHERQLGQLFEIEALCEVVLTHTKRPSVLEETVDYQMVQKKISMLVQDTSFELLEALAYHIVQSLFNEFSPIQGIELRIRKQLPSAQVGVQLRVTRDSLTL